MSDIRAGGVPTDKKLLSNLLKKHGTAEKLDEKSLTFCSGQDYVNISYQHVVCPDAETAKVSKFYIKTYYKDLNLLIDMARRFKKNYS